MLDKVAQFYLRAFMQESIELEIQEIGAPLFAKCTDAALMQLFINLFDNALYWLRNVDKSNMRQIIIQLDGDDNKLIFADNGPGIFPDLVPYVFDSFVSGKGDDGRGLGLYIACQLLERMDFTIDIADRKRDKLCMELVLC